MIDTQIKYFTENTGGITQCIGIIGKLITLLDQVLVNGFNNNTIISFTIDTNIGTILTNTIHNYHLNDVIKIEGANEAELNGEFRVVEVPNNTQFKISIDTIETVATGTLTCKIASLGWTKEYSDTNKAVYRSPSGTRRFLRVEHLSAYYGKINGYDTMTNVDTGTGETASYYWKISDNTTSERPFKIVGCERSFYFLCSWNGDTTIRHNGGGFGEFISLRNGDIMNTFIIGSTATAPTTVYNNQSFTYINGSANTTGHQVLGILPDNPTPTLFYKQSTPSGQMGYGTDVTLFNYADNGIHLFPLNIIESSIFRGQLPGIFVPFENINNFFANGDRTVIIDGNEFIAVRIYCNNGSGACWFSTKPEHWGLTS